MKQTDETGEVSYGLHEVFYSRRKADGWTEQPVIVVGESVESVRWCLEKMALALEKPVLDYETGKEVT
ncbi:hypothetical protein [Zavarzinella formosa]|uniref:hypothetical protein n=1 Tax=Zavarzinella formosa TaxID=360055 RepID=UPI0002FBE9A9|nr:hypothetical protein [Zavarzinella formosa]